MKRAALLCVCLAGLLGVAAPTVTAGHSGDGGTIFYDGGLDWCGLIAQHEDGSPWFFLGSMHDLGTSHVVTTIGGTFSDDPDEHVGWICTWSATQYGPLPGSFSVPLVLTGLTCEFYNAYYPLSSKIRPGRLTSSGTAIIDVNGNVRVICPPSERLPFP
jgi:hypothetical protein